MNTVINTFKSEYEINKSTFISLIISLKDKNDVKNILNSIKKDYPKATHYCYAYSCASINKSNDDGEPAGTAGKPILEMILKHNLDNVLVVVVRYFGGIKLGASGLLRAYLEAANRVIDKAELFHEEKRKIYQIEVDYNLNEAFKRYMKENNIEIIDVQYQQKIVYKVSSLEIDQEDLNNYLNCKISVILLDERIVLVKN